MTYAVKKINDNSTQISQITQIKNENRYGMNSMIFVKDRELRALRIISMG